MQLKSFILSCLLLDVICFIKKENGIMGTRDPNTLDRYEIAILKCMPVVSVKNSFNETNNLCCSVIVFKLNPPLVT